MESNFSNVNVINNNPSSSSLQNTEQGQSQWRLASPSATHNTDLQKQNKNLKWDSAHQTDSKEVMWFSCQKLPDHIQLMSNFKPLNISHSDQGKTKEKSVFHTN